MRLMAYNILDGGDESLGDRTELILSVIRSHDPDVLGLCECAGFGTEARDKLAEFCAKLKMTAVMNVAPSGNHVAILTKPGVDVVRSSTLSVGMYNGAVEVVARTSIGETAFVMTHLHPQSSILRVAEAEIVTSQAAYSAEAVIMGDLNSLSPQQGKNSFDALCRPFQRRVSTPQGLPDTGPADLLAARGFVDLGAESAASTYPSSLPGAEEAGPSARLDYVFATPRVADASSDFVVDTGDVAHLASDHLPVVVDLRI